MDKKKLCLVGVLLGVVIGLVGIAMFAIEMSSGEDSSMPSVLFAAVGFLLFLLSSIAYVIVYFAEKYAPQNKRVQQKTTMQGISKTVAQYIGAAVTVSVMVALLIGLGFDFNLFTFILIVIPTFLVFAYIDKLYKKKYAQIEQHIKVVKDEKCSVSLLQRSSISASILKIDQIMKTHTQYHGPELVYTGATVGGIHTGGFHVNKAHLTEKSLGGSGKYYLYIHIDDYAQLAVVQIYLTEAMIEQARNDERVSKFLQGNKLCLWHSGNDTQFTNTEKMMLNNAVNTNDYAAQLNFSQRASLAKQLTYDECIDVINWISGK